MLFAVKNYLLATVLLLVLLVAGAVWARDALGLVWPLHPRASLPGALLVAVVLLAASDAILHGLLLLVLGEWYRVRYRALVEYFRPQGTPQIIAGGLLAGAEELVFRGVLLEGLYTVAGLSSPAAVGISSLVFGALHAIPRRKLLPFAVWAAWEGVVLGTVYVVSGSLLVSVVSHVIHDLAGFTLFAVQRRTGWLL